MRVNSHRGTEIKLPLMIQNLGEKNIKFTEQSGAVEACWAHNPEVRGSKPRSAIHFEY